MFEIRTRLIRIVLEFWAFFKIMINVPFEIQFVFVWLPNNDLIKKILKICLKRNHKIIHPGRVRPKYKIYLMSLIESS